MCWGKIFTTFCPQKKDLKRNLPDFPPNQVRPNAEEIGKDVDPLFSSDIFDISMPEDPKRHKKFISKMKNVCGKVHSYRNVSENVRCKFSQGICAQIKIS
jgi:hypothetical protein